MTTHLTRQKIFIRFVKIFLLANGSFVEIKVCLKILFRYLDLEIFSKLDPFENVWLIISALTIDFFQ